MLGAELFNLNSIYCVNMSMSPKPEARATPGCKPFPWMHCLLVVRVLLFIRGAKGFRFFLVGMYHVVAVLSMLVSLDFARRCRYILPAGSRRISYA